MSGRAQEAIRKMLRQSRNGMTVKEIADQMGGNKPYSVRCTRDSLFAMPDVYVSSWKRNHHNMWVAVWSCVTPPPPAPRPEA